MSDPTLSSDVTNNNTRDSRWDEMRAEAETYFQDKICRFIFNEIPVRVVRRDGCIPLFVLKDVCLALGLNNTSRLSRRLIGMPKDYIIFTPAGGLARSGEFGSRNRIIDQDALRKALNLIKTPSSAAFRTWVQQEVFTEFEDVDDVEWSTGESGWGEAPNVNSLFQGDYAVHPHAADAQITTTDQREFNQDKGHMKVTVFGSAGLSGISCVGPVSLIRLWLW